VPGYLYLGSFGLIGAGELGGAFFSSALLSWSLPIDAVRDMSILNLAVPAAGPAASVHGILTDRWGFSASFAFGFATAVLALTLIWRLPKHRLASK
jgi:hypothetical protein